MMKKLWMIMLSVLLLLSANAMAEPTNYYIKVRQPENVWVAITSENASDVFSDGTVSYDADTHTLILNGANLAYISGLSNAAENQKIKLIGESRVSTLADEQMFSISYFSNLEIYGSGSLIVSNEYVNSEGYGYPCIQTEGKLMINGAEIEATSKDNTSPIYCVGDMEIKNGAKVTSHAGNFPGLNSYNLTIDSSEVKVDTTSHGIYVPGKLKIIGDSVVDVTAGSNGVALESIEDVYIGDESQVTLSGGWGIWSVNGGVEISGGRVEITSDISAIVNKPDLSKYVKAAVFAGKNKASASRMDVDSQFYGNKYVRIQPEEVLPENNNVNIETDVPQTGDHSRLGLWALLLGCCSFLLYRKRRAA